MEKEIIQCSIEDLAFGGQGVARIDGFVVFVPMTIPGEVVEIRILEKKKDYGLAELISVVEPSPARINPHCPYFSECQGCTYQHMDYTEEIKWKAKQIKDIFVRIGGFSCPPMLDPAPCPHDLHYRNKVRLRYKKLKDIHLFGYILSEKRRTLDIEKCPIASHLINQKIQEIRNNGFSLFEEQGQRSYNLVIIEDGTQTYTALEGDVTLNTSVCGKQFSYSINSFFQVNRTIFPVLYDYMSGVIGNPESKQKYMCDLYCGVGFFGILFSEYFENVHFIEQNKVSYRFLERNIALNKISNAQLIKSDAREAVKDMKERYDVMIIDPPRSGCDEAVCQSLSEIRPKKLIYISCNPSTMARDIRRLCDTGFQLISLKPFDFFPRTKHIEVVAVLKTN